MAVFDENWQKARATIAERGIFMFNNDLLSDVSLVVRGSSDEGEPKKTKMAIPAHKFVLSSCSPVFFAMFCGEMAEKSDSVDLPDCEYEGVLEMLRYMYSDEAKLNESNVMQVWYVANKYILPSLVEECFQYVFDNLWPSNVFCVLSHAQQYEEKDLMHECWKVIDSETEKALKSEGFASIKRSLLEEVVKRDTLTIREVDLFKAVDRWATQECERQGISTDGNMKRSILGVDIIKAIRFPVMESKEFASVVLGSKILTQEEAFDIMKYFNSVLDSPVCFPEKERVGRNLSCFRFERMDRDGLDYSEDKKECIDLQVDTKIELYGIRMFGRKDSEHVVILKVKESRIPNAAPIASKSGMFSSWQLRTKSSFYYGFDVLFDVPVVLRKATRYCIKATIDGPHSWYGVNGFSEVRSHGVKFSFFNCQEQDCRTLTDVKLGQFAELLFRLR